MKLLLSIYGIALSIFCMGQIDQNLVEKFIRNFPKEYQISSEEVKSIIDKAVYREEIIQKMNRPAEAMPWHKYRDIFMTPDRIEQGVEFWTENKQVLDSVSRQTGVPAEIILGILGVETFYGQIKGSYRVLDALYTLAFGYPKRSTYFTRELQNFIALAREENLNVDSIKGSYAGAMGYCQFMPSSYRAYAISFDEMGSRDLVNDVNDAIASIANYLTVHRWKENQDIVFKANASDNAVPMDEQSLRPKKTFNYYNAMGYYSSEITDPNSMVTLIQLEQPSAKEFWFGFDNFYVITRYNHSPLYAMAVFQLSEAIKSKI